MSIHFELINHTDYNKSVFCEEHRPQTIMEDNGWELRSHVLLAQDATQWNLTVLLLTDNYD